jgi:hypothetical protein
MTSLFVLIFLVLGTGVNSNFLVSPEDSYLLKLSDAPTPCYIDSDKNNVLEYDKPSRTEGFRMRGSYKCDRPIFEYGERDSFVDYVTAHQIARAQSVAQVLNQKIGIQIREKIFGPIILEIQTDDESLRSTLLATFTNEIIQTIGPNSIQRELHKEKNTNSFKSSKGMQSSALHFIPRVMLKVNRLQDPIEFLNVMVLLPEELGDLKWQKI